MHKVFYASGFIYHSPSRQILLQQFQNGEDLKLTLFRGKSRKGEDPLAVFRRCIHETLGVNLDNASIMPIYDYIHDTLGDHFIFYVEVSDTVLPSQYSNDNVAWFSLTKLSKLNIAEQTKHDIIVGERVIRAAEELKQPPAAIKHH